MFSSLSLSLLLLFVNLSVKLYLTVYLSVIASHHHLSLSCLCVFLAWTSLWTLSLSLRWCPTKGMEIRNFRGKIYTRVFSCIPVINWETDACLWFYKRKQRGRQQSFKIQKHTEHETYGLEWEKEIKHYKMMYGHKKKLKRSLKKTTDIETLTHWTQHCSSPAKDFSFLLHQRIIPLFRAVVVVLVPSSSLSSSWQWSWWIPSNSSFVVKQQEKWEEIEWLTTLQRNTLPSSKGRRGRKGIVAENTSTQTSLERSRLPVSLFF